MMRILLSSALPALGVIGMAAVLVGPSLFLVLLVTRPSWPQCMALSKLPAWAWCGGLLGAMYVATATVFAPRLGAAVFIVAVVAGQLVSSLVLDGRGWFGYAMRDLSLGRIVGVLLVAIGCALVTLSTAAKPAT